MPRLPRFLADLPEPQRARLGFGALVAGMLVALVVVLRWDAGEAPAAQTGNNIALKEALNRDADRLMFDSGAGAAQPVPALARPIAADPGFVSTEAYCGGDAACLRDPSTPRSAEDASWLKVHGYPDRNRRVELERLDEDALRRAGTRELAAMAVLAERLAAEGRRDEALKVWIAAAQRGSLHAYHGIAALVAADEARGGAREAAAYLRLAYLLGDHGAAQALYRQQPGLQGEALAQVDRRALALYASFAKFRVPFPRPQ